MLRKVERVAGIGVDRILHRHTDDAMVAVDESITRVWVMSENRFWLVLANGANNFAAEIRSVFQATVS